MWGKTLLLNLMISLDLEHVKDSVLMPRSNLDDVSRAQFLKGILILWIETGQSHPLALDTIGAAALLSLSSLITFSISISTSQRLLQ